MTVRRFGDVEVVEIAAKSVLNAVSGMPFGWSINPYQGCAHQCVFCYARSTHAYRDLDGERSWGKRLFAKLNAPAALRAELAHPRWRNEHVAIGTATDPYQPIEARYRLTRGIITELARARTPAHLITRSPLVVRDLDVLTELASVAEFGVAISIATLDDRLAREIEPTVPAPHARLRAVARLAAAGIATSVAVAPLMPGINDDAAGIAAVVHAAAESGATRVWHSSLRLGRITKDAFFGWLDDARPHLTGRYRALYPGGYAPAATRAAADDAVGAGIAAATWSPPPVLPVAAAPQLALFPAER